MKVKISLSLKLTLIVIILSAMAILAVTYLNVYYHERFFADATHDRSKSIIRGFNATIEGVDQLQDNDFLENKVGYFFDQEEDIIKFTINMPNDQNELTAFFSSDDESVGSLEQSYSNIDSYENDNIWYILDSEKKQLMTITPIKIDGEIVGTYEIILSVEEEYASYDIRIRNTIAISIFSFFALIFASLLLLRKTIVKPILRFRKTARTFGKGNLDARIDIKSKDELGDLANAFNDMAKDLKESRGKIQDYNEILKNLLQQKDEFIGQLGHDLKNPLQPLVGLLPMLIEKEKDPKIKEDLELINKNAQYMRELIFKTLQLAKLRSSNIKFDFEDLNLSEQVNDVIDTEKLNLKEHKIEIENKIDEKTIVNADKLRISEVFKNLITNAVKYTPEDGGKITIDAKKEDKFVTVSVQDTGMGMTKDQIKKVFDEFYKAKADTGDYQSSGLGLAICKRIVEKHGGKIWVESPGPKMGSTFFFTVKSGSEK